MEEIIQLKITLNGTKPSIWRRVQLDKATPFLNLNYIIQIAMGWTNSHLFEFTVKGTRIAELFDDYDAEFDGETSDASIVSLESIISQPKEKFIYLYDFGDFWDHTVEVEKFLPRDNMTKYPICIAGELNCPPEDCGGIGGFYHLLQVIKNKKHPEHKEMLEWLGDDYDPEHFNMHAVNENLSSIDKWLDFE